MKRRDAFTLTELLVLIPIIALLGTLLLASLGDAKQTLQAAQCLSNMRQWGLAIGLYCNDYNDYMPYQGVTGDVCGNGNFNAGAWFNILGPYISQPRLCDLYNQGKIPMPGVKSIFVCPSAPMISWTPTEENPYHRYAMNRALTRFAGKAYRRSIAVKPAETVLLAESNPDGTPQCWPFTDGYRIGSFGVPSQNIPTHSGGMNFTFVDGRAQWYTQDDYTRTAAEINNNVGSQVEWAHDPPYKIYWWPCPTCHKD